MSWANVMVTPGVAPPWLLGPTGTKLLTSMGQAIDTLDTKIAAAAEVGMPTKCDATALPFIGNDRVMPQGPSEGTASYRTRLQKSITVWRNLAGTPWGVMRAALSMVLPDQPRVRHITNTSAWDTFEAGADVTQPPWHYLWNGDNTVPGQMQWDGVGFTDPSPSGVSPWWRFWLVLYATGVPWAASSGTWGSSGKKWGDASKVWGFTSGGSALPLTVFPMLQQVVRQWKAEHSWCRWIIVSFDDTLFDPWQTADGTHNPAGTFGRWSKITSRQYVPARFPNARYLDCPP